MFLSKTNSGQTVAVAFRRKSEAIIICYENEIREII